ncbi:LCP family protein [Candidatus Azambacteria bacterium]|nr:LCP family protein [Candidatus Azambacteria bacterium]
MKVISLILKLAAVGALAAAVFFIRPAAISGDRASSHEPPLSLTKIAFNFLADTEAPLKGQERDRINVLVLGMTGVPHPAPFLTDTIIIASIKPSPVRSSIASNGASTSKLALLSIPRDLLVKIPGSGARTKINALFAMNGKDPALLAQTIETITGQPIDYYLVLDVSGTQQIVDSLGGLNVLVPDDVNDLAFPTDTGGTETFAIEKGWRYFDGATVQKYLRTRHSKGGDFARMRQQQAVIEALRKKVFGLNMLYDFPTVLSLYRTLTAHIQTDIGEKEVKRFYDIAQNISYDNVIHTVVDGDPKDASALLKSKTIELGGMPAFVLVPKTGDFDYYSITETATNIFNKP